MVFTGLTALYKRGIIDFNPSCLYISLRHGKDSAKNIESRLGVEEVKVDFETKTYDLFSEDYKGQRVYSVERLLIEINKWALSNEMKDKAINRLIKESKPHLLMKVYKEVFKKRRGYDLDPRVEKILKNFKKPVDSILEGDSQKKINEYLLKQIDDLKLPVVIKGGTAIQTYWDTNRKTLDIDSHSVRERINEIIERLSNSKNAIRFKPCMLMHRNGIDEIGPSFSFNKIKGKNVIKLAMIPVVYGSSNKLKNLFVKFTINISISNIDEVISSFKLTKRKIGIFNADVLVFSKEMLIAEKYHSLITKPINTQRSKDLLDIWFLCDESYDIKIVIKWLKIKFSSSKNSFEWKEALELIDSNKLIELPKIFEQWSATNEMFSVDIDFNDAFDKYKELSLSIQSFK